MSAKQKVAVATARTGKKQRSKNLSLSARSGVLFPVGRMRRYFKNMLWKVRIGIGSPIYTAAVIEYLVAEVLELAGNAARDNKRLRITPRHILLAIANDEELSELLKGVTIPSGGVLPRIEPQLLGRKKGSHFWNEVPNPSWDEEGMDEGEELLVPKPLPLRTKVTPVAKEHPAPASPKKMTVTLATTRRVQGTPTFAGEARPAGSRDPSTGLVVLLEKKLFLGQRLAVMRGDVGKTSVDAVVNPTTSSFQLNSDVGKSLASVGGKEFQNEVKEMLRAQGTLDTAGAALCDGRNLPARYVIHVNPPTVTQQGAITLLEKSVQNVLALADEKKLKTVAMPSLCSSGHVSFAKETAAEHILKATKSYFMGVVSSSIRQVYFILDDNENVGAFLSELASLNPEG